MKYNHLSCCNNYFYYRIKIPVDLSNHFPSPTFKKSLKTTDIKTARCMAVCMEYKVQQAFAMIRTGMLTTDIIKSIVAEILPSTKVDMCNSCGWLKCTCSACYYGGCVTNPYRGKSYSKFNIRIGNMEKLYIFPPTRLSKSESLLYDAMLANAEEYDRIHNEVLLDAAEVNARNYEENTLEQLELIHKYFTKLKVY